MDNATHENSIHPAIQSCSCDQDDFTQFPQDEFMESLESNEIKGILNHLNQINLSPRAVSIRAIMKYAHEKNEAVH